MRAGYAPWVLLSLALGLWGCQRSKPMPTAPSDYPGLSATTTAPSALPSPSPTLGIQPTATPAYTVHLVAFGENLSSIALLYSVSEEAIAQANGLVAPYLIFVGQELLVPAAEVSPSPTLAPTPTASASGQLTHVVQPGENLFRIALRYGVTVEALEAANGLTSDLIYVGQELIIPLP